MAYPLGGERAAKQRRSVRTGSTRAGSDGELLAAWRCGDTGAGDALVRRYYANVLRFFEYRTAAAAEDLTQRTFAACAEALSRLRRDGAFGAFLFGIARNQLLKFLRSRPDDHDLSRMDVGDDAFMKSWLSTVIVRRDEQRVLLQALVALPERLQTPLVLFYWEGMRAREIGSVLDIPTSTATTRLARARDLLREQIERVAGAGRSRDRLVSDVGAWLASLVDTTAAKPGEPL